MIALPNGCCCGNLSVYPKNWQAKDARISFDWYITYRFYDPKYGKPKQVIVKGMNHFKTRSERQQATKNLLSTEAEKLIKDSYNPFQVASNSAQSKSIINPQTGLLNALICVYEKIEV